MRNLTITRTKSFIACFLKMKVYIEDSEHPEITINDTPCRKLGILKNGETQTFAIDETSAKVFVITDTLSKNYCNDYYTLPEGSEDVVLSGKNRYNPANRNAFRFDNNDSEDVTANRKKGLKKGLTVLIIAFVVGLAIGFTISFISNLPPKGEPKTFAEAGMQITLTDKFEEFDAESQTVCYQSSDVMVMALKEEFSIYEGLSDLSMNDYIDLVFAANDQLTQSKLQRENGLVFFEYEATNGATYKYRAYLFKTDDAFWMIQFVAEDKDFSEYTDEIDEWAQSIQFD